VIHDVDDNRRAFPVYLDSADSVVPEPSSAWLGLLASTVTVSPQCRSGRPGEHGTRICPGPVNTVLGLMPDRCSWGWVSVDGSCPGTAPETSAVLIRQS